MTKLRCLASDKWISEVCGGLTKAYSWSPVAFKLIYVLPLLLIGFIPLLIIYSIASLLAKQG